jgi:hypothetical protein
MLAAILGFVVSNGLKNSTKIPWKFALKWWPEEASEVEGDSN